LAGPRSAGTFRRANSSDALCLSALATQVFLETYATEGIRPWLAREVQEHLSPPALTELLAKPSTEFLLAERSGHLIAFAQLAYSESHPLVVSERPAELERLYVQSPFTSRGVGTALLQHAEARAVEHGAGTLWLTAWIGNHKALRFYSRQGYRELGSTSYTFEDQSFENRLFAKHLASSSEG
jgi:diamine N-acetyltransferase